MSLTLKTDPEIRRALGFFRPDLGRIALAFGILISAILAGLLKPWPLAVMIDSVLGNEPLPRLIHAAGDWPKPVLLAVFGLVIFGLHALQGALGAFQNYVSIKVGLRGLARVRTALFERLQRLSLRFYQSRTQGDVIYRASWDTYAFQTLFQQAFFSLVQATVTLVLMITVMAQMNGRLTWVALVIVPMLLAVMSFFARKMKQRSLAAHQADSRVTAAFQQNINALPVIQSDVRESDEAARFVEHAKVALEKRSAQHGLEVGYWFAMAVVFGLATAAVTWVGGAEVLANRLSTGELLVFLAYLAQLYEPLNQLSQVGATVAEAGAGVQRVFELFDTVDEVKESPHARAVVREISQPNANIGVESRRVSRNPPLVVRGEVEFDRVTFSYEPARFVLDNISFKLPSRTAMGLVGPSGAGKTTLLQLLPRFYDPGAGAIRLDGADLRELKLADLRRQIAIVWQEPLLLPGTVAENISYGRPTATQKEIEAAARAAHAHDFVMHLPQQYETLIGDGAARLSVGEKQRITIARAFLKDAPIILLDEPTSALDSESEALVLDGLWELVRGRTAILVAHRPSTLQRVDRVMRIKDGRITPI